MITVDELFTEWLDANGSDIIGDLYDIESMIQEKVDELCDKKFDKIDIDGEIKTVIESHVQDAVEDAENRLKQLEFNAKNANNCIVAIRDELYQKGRSIDSLIKEVSALQAKVYGWNKRWWEFWK